MGHGKDHDRGHPAMLLVRLRSSTAKVPVYHSAAMQQARSPGLRWQGSVPSTLLPCCPVAAGKLPSAIRTRQCHLARATTPRFLEHGSGPLAYRCLSNPCPRETQALIPDLCQDVCFWSLVEVNPCRTLPHSIHAGYVRSF